MTAFKLKIPGFGLDVSSAGGGQIAFPAAQNPSADTNTLDDYEEGSFTPVINRDATNSTLTYTTQIGTYTKVGRKVTVSIYIVINSMSVAGTGNNIVTGLPFTSAASGRSAGSVASNSAFATTSVQSCFLMESDSMIRFSPPGPSAGQVSEAWTSGGVLLLTITYFTA